MIFVGILNMEKDLNAINQAVSYMEEEHDNNLKWSTGDYIKKWEIDDGK